MTASDHVTHVQAVFPQTYAYAGGTLHLVPWAWCFCGLVWIWLTFFTHGPSTLRSQHGFFLVVFGFFFIGIGLFTEWSLRNQPGRIIAHEDGLTCTLPWGRQHHFRWGEIREVCCIARRFHRDISLWEIRSSSSKERLFITWELKGYKDLLRTIQQRAINCQRFDPID